MSQIESALTRLRQWTEAEREWLSGPGTGLRDAITAVLEATKHIGEPPVVLHQGDLHERSDVAYAQAATAVEAGGRFLDARDRGWMNLIDLGTLDMASTTDDILGQLQGGYRIALGRLDLSSARAADLGFDRGNGHDFSYADLRRAWTELILARREGGRQGGWL